MLQGAERHNGSRSQDSKSAQSYRRDAVEVLVYGGFLRNSAWAVGGRVVGALSSLFATALVTRILSPSGVGTYLFVASIAMFLSLLSQGGLDQLIVRLVANAKADGRPSGVGVAARATVRLLCGSLFVSALLTGIVFSLFGHWISNTAFSTLSVLAVVCWVIGQAVYKFIAEVFRGLYELKTGVLVGQIMPSVALVMGMLGVYLISKHAGVQTVLLVAGISAALSALFAGKVLSRILRIASEGGEVSLLELVREAWPFLVISLTAFLSDRFDLWVVAGFLPVADVAIYGTAAKLVSIIAIPLGIAYAVLPARIAAMYRSGDVAALEQMLRTVVTWAGLAGLVVCVGIWFLGGGILGLVFGHYYSHGDSVLLVLAIGQAVNLLSGPCGLVLNLIGYQRSVMRIISWTSIGAALGAIVLVRFYGVVGVAMATAVGAAVQNVLLVVVALKHGQIRTYFSFRLLFGIFGRMMSVAKC